MASRTMKKGGRPKHAKGGKAEHLYNAQGSPEAAEAEDEKDEKKAKAKKSKSAKNESESEDELEKSKKARNEAPKEDAQATGYMTMAEREKLGKELF